MDEFSQEELDSLIEEALSENPTKFQPKNAPSLGLMESQMLSAIYASLEKKLVGSEVSRIFQDARSSIVSAKVPYDLKDLHTVVKNCRKCKLDKVDPQLPKWNVKDPDVLFIADNASISKESAEILIKGMKQSGFDSSKVCLTYLTRCPIYGKPEPSTVYNCSSYIHSEIQIMNPKLIVTLGLLPLASLLNTNVQLKAYRGQLVWLGHWPIISTYSPTYCVNAGKQVEEEFISDVQQAYDFCYS